MMTFALTIGLFALLMAAMSIGVVFSGRALKGSCGGTGADCACDAQGKPRECEQPQDRVPKDPAPVAIGNPTRVT